MWRLTKHWAQCTEHTLSTTRRHACFGKMAGPALEVFRFGMYVAILTKQGT